MLQFGLRERAEKWEIPFGSAQGRLSLRLKNGSARDDDAGSQHGMATWDDNAVEKAKLHRY
jgi:hypothetical protein